MTTVFDSRKIVDLRTIDVAVVSTFPPTRCGIGRFTNSLVQAWSEVATGSRFRVERAVSNQDRVSRPGTVDGVFDPTSPVAVRSAARRVDQADAVVVQHEYGIYGPDDGVALLDLVDRVTVPVISVMHTVLRTPSSRQRMIVDHLAARGVLVVPSNRAAELLVTVHGLDPSGIEVIPHGSSWTPSPLRPAPRRRLMSWGLLGPGKGIERGLRSLARLDLDPPVTYDVIGQTHPQVLATSGQVYRRRLLSLVDELGLADRVRFIDRYVGDDELQTMATAADLVLVPYDNDEQISSGVLTDALALGKPVVATAFPHAQELLADGAGICVDHGTEQMAAAVTHLLTDDDAYRAAAGAARLRSSSFSWEVVAAQYLRLLHEVRATAGVA